MRLYQAQKLRDALVLMALWDPLAWKDDVQQEGRGSMSPDQLKKRTLKWNAAVVVIASREQACVSAWMALLAQHVSEFYVQQALIAFLAAATVSV
jgi:hypothetical protein